ncbi:hypothetical protein BCV72DRAFT_236027, partial [Rhizopus microsporus var. microsporus]
MSISSVPPASSASPSVGPSSNDPSGGISAANATVSIPLASASLSVSLPAKHMQIDQASADAVAMAEAAQACKYIMHPTFSIAPRDTNTIYVPIVVENIKTWAMIDTGATFSCVSPSFCSALDLVPLPPK